MFPMHGTVIPTMSHFTALPKNDKGLKFTVQLPLGKPAIHYENTSIFLNKDYNYWLAIWFLISRSTTDDAIYFLAAFDATSFCYLVPDHCGNICPIHLIIAILFYHVPLIIAVLFYYMTLIIAVLFYHMTLIIAVLFHHVPLKTSGTILSHDPNNCGTILPRAPNNCGPILSHDPYNRGTILSHTK